MILNLNSFNQHIEYQYFKMDLVWTAIRLMTPSCYMASIDLKDAYYFVPIAKSHQKYLKFEWKNMLSQFVFSQWAGFLSQKVYQANEAGICHPVTAWSPVLRLYR